MSGFVAWAVSWQGTAGLMVCALVLGMILGWLAGVPTGRRRAEHEVAEDLAATRAVRQVRSWGPPVPQPAKPVGWPVDPVWNQAEGKWVCGYGCDARSGMNPLCPMHGEVTHEWEPAHVASALALASDDPTVSAWTADMAASMDRWLAEHVYGVPYSADELWSGQ